MRPSLMRIQQTMTPGAVSVFARCLIAMALFLSATVLVCVNCEAASKDSLADLVSNPQTWSNFDWSRPDESSVLRLESWEQYSGKQEWPDRVLIKRQTAQLAGLPFEARWSSVADKSGSHNQLNFAVHKFSRQSCTKVLEWIASHFGQPYVAVDRTIRSSSAEVDDRQSEWEIGSTRVHVACLVYFFPASKEFHPTILLIKFTSTAATQRARPLAAINCSRHFEYRGFDKPPTKEPDQIFLIDEDRQKVRYQSNVSLDGEHVITSTTVSAKFTDNKLVPNLEIIRDLAINRITGTLREELSNTKENFSVIVTGTCEPIDLQRRKF